MTTKTEVADELVTELGAIATKTYPTDVANSSMAGRMLTLAEGYQVSTAEEYRFAAEDLRRIMDQSKAMDAERTSFTGPLNAILSKLNLRFQPHIKTLDKAAAVLKQKMGAFTAEQQRLADEERRRAEAAAAAERQRLADLAAAERRQAEERAAAERRAEQERQAAAAAEQRKLDEAAAAARGAKAKKEAAERAEAQRVENERLAAEQRAREEADRLEAERKAQALEATASMVIAQPSAAVAITQAQGVSTRTLIDYEITDPAAFLRWILDVRPDMLPVVDFDGVKMRAFTKLAGLQTKAPGLRVFPKSSVAVR